MVMYLPNIRFWLIVILITLHLLSFTFSLIFLEKIAPGGNSLRLSFNTISKYLNLNISSGITSRSLSPKTL